MTPRQIYTAPTVTTRRENHSLPRTDRTDPMQAHTQFLPADRATQILLQQFL